MPIKTLKQLKKKPRSIGSQDNWHIMHSRAASLLFVTIIVGITISVTGCGKSKPLPGTKSASNTVSNVSRNDDGGVTSDHGSPTQKESTAAEPTPDDSALASVTATLRAIEQGDLAGAYDFLPKSYQSDIDGLLHEFATRMDAEVWTRLVTTMRKSVQVLRTRKGMILELDLIANRPDAAILREKWDRAVGMLEQFASNSAIELTELRKNSAKSLLPNASSNVMKELDELGLGIGADLARQFSGIKVASLRTAGDSQFLSFQSPRDEKPFEVEYVQQEGRWLPKSLVTQWANGIKADREWLSTLPDQIKAAKPRLMEGLSQFDEHLDRMLAASNRDEFQQAVAPMILTLAVAWPRLEQLGRQSALGKVDQPPTTIVFQTELSESDQDKFAEAVLKSLMERGTDYTMLSNDGRTVCRLTRLADARSLPEKLVQHFKLKPSQVVHDAENFRIEVRFTE